MPDRLILCSGSPRRKELLESAGYAFEVEAADIAENPALDGRGRAERAHRAAQKMAEAKADAVSERRRSRHGDLNGEVYLAADTIVVLGDEILGKPKNDADAKRMLDALSGKKHQVVTAFAVRRSDDARWETTSVLTDVVFKRATSREIDAYVATGEPRDKAGAYAIQGIGGFLVEAIYGSYSNVVGLPLVEVMRSFRQLTDLVPRPGSIAGTLPRAGSARKA